MSRIGESACYRCESPIVAVGDEQVDGVALGEARFAVGQASEAVAGGDAAQVG